MNHYSFSVLWSEEDQEYVALSPEFPGLSGLGSDPASAIQALQEAIEATIESMVHDGEQLPEPQHLDEVSGQFRLRLTRSQHALLRARADSEGVSLNSLAQVYIASGLGSDLLGGIVTRRLQSVLSSLEAATIRLSAPSPTNTQTLDVSGRLPRHLLYSDTSTNSSPTTRIH